MKSVSSKVKPWLQLSILEKEFYKSFTNARSHYNSPFHQYGFVQSVAKVNPYVYVLILYRDDQPFFFLPYQYKGKLDRIVGLAERVASNMSDIFGPVLEPGSSISHKDILNFIDFKLLNFDHLPINSCDFTVPIDSKQLASQIVVEDGANSYFEWLKESNKKFYSDTARRKRKATEALGPIKFVFNNPSKLELDRLVAKKREQYARTKVSDSLNENWTLRLLEELFINKDSAFEPVLSTLYCGDTWLASHLGIKANGILQYWLPVYDIKFRNYAPGRLLLFENIAALQGNKLSIIDRGEGISDSKKDTANLVYQMGKGAINSSSKVVIFSRILQKYRWSMQS